jgi:TolB-like protein
MKDAQVKCRVLLREDRSLKKWLLVIFVMCLLFFSCATRAPAPSVNTVSLDQVIRAAAAHIESSLEKDVKIAILNFSSSSEEFSGYVLEELSDYLVNSRKLVVVDRRELDLIRQEEQFQMSGDVSDESAQAIGKKLGAQLIVSGSLTDLGGTYRFRIKALNVETAAVEVSSASDLSANEQKLVFLLEGRSSVADGIYQIGDIGPGGGIVFYDKGLYESGWRYLEAAPGDFQYEVPWGAFGIDVDGTKTGIGSGKRNTELIVQKLKKLGEQGRAAQLCAAYDGGGYKDWFLPSRDELDIIYWVYSEGILDLDLYDEVYWSSSQLDETYVWCQFFYDGDQDGISKDDLTTVRAIRAF